MPIPQNTGFHILAPEPIDKRMQTQNYAGLDAIPIKYNHMVCHVIGEDKDYRYYADVPEWRPIEYGSTVIWGDITGNVLQQTDLINYLEQNYEPLGHEHPTGPHRHWPADIYDVDGIVTWVREHEALNYILTGSTDSTGVFQGTMNDFIVSDGTNSSHIEDGDTLTFEPNFILDPLTNTIQYVETDPTVPSWVKAITQQDISEWDMAYAHSLTDHGFEWWLGNPPVDGYILSSLADGTRLWVENTGGSGTWQPNTQAQEGYVEAGGSNFNRVWATDGAGNPSWLPLPSNLQGDVAVQDFNTPSLVWVFNHNLGVLNPNIDAWSTNTIDGEKLIPEKIIVKSITQAEIHFSTPATGRAVGMIGAGGYTLPTNVALTDVSNLFTEKQNIYETVSDTVLQLRSNLRTYVGIGFRESSEVGSDTGFVGIKRTDVPAASDSELHFRNSKSGVISTSMMIDTAGNVGIGTTTPSEKLDVVGNGLFSGTVNASNLSGTNTGDQDISGLVPYTGATEDVDLGVHNILATALKLAGGENITWNTKYHTIQIPNGDGAITKVGLDTLFEIHNATGGTLTKGTVVYPDGTSTAGVSNVQKCISNSFETVQGPIGLIAEDVLNGADGHVMVKGVLDPIDTSGLSEGLLYVSDTIAGAVTNIRPKFPSFDISIGIVDSSNINGVITVDSNINFENVLTHAWDGTVMETFDFRITSNGTIITGTLSNPNITNTDLTCVFSDGFYKFDISTKGSIQLVPGSATVPQMNYVYIDAITKVLTVSTSDFPVTQHAKIAIIALLDASNTQTNGALRNQNTNDHVKSDNDNGHLLHMAERLRSLNADWSSGVLTTLAGTPTNLYIANTSGKIWQMHKQSFPSYSMALGDDIHIVNDPTTPYRATTNLNTVNVYSDGTTWNNQWTNIVVWGVSNKTGEVSHLMCNLSINGYSSEDDAIADGDSYTNYTIPRAFKGVGFLVARFTIRRSGSTFTYNSSTGYLDLRGFVPNNTAGGGTGSSGITDFLGLNDTPSSFIGQGGSYLKVNGTATALEFSNFAADVAATPAVVLNTAKIGLTLNSIGVAELKPAFKTVIDLGNVSGTVNLDWSLAVRYKCNLIGNTTLTFSNVTNYVGVKTQQLELTSNLDTYTLAHPTGVDTAVDLTDIDLTLTNHITYFCHRLTTPFYQSSVKTE